MWPWHSEGSVQESALLGFLRRGSVITRVFHDISTASHWEPDQIKPTVQTLTICSKSQLCCDSSQRNLLEKCSVSRAGTCVGLPLQNSTTDSNHNWEKFAVNMQARRQTRVRTQPFAGLYERVAVKYCGGKGGEWQYELFADVFSNIQETILPKALGQLHPSSLNSVCMNRWAMALLPTKLPYYEWPSPTCHIYTTVKESTSAVESVQGVSAGCWRPQPHTAFSEDPPPNKPLDCCLSHTQRVVFSPAGPNWKAFHHVHC